MGWMIVVFIISVIVLLISTEKFFESLLSGLFFGIFIGLICYILFGGIVGLKVGTEWVVEETPIVALNDNSSAINRHYLTVSSTGENYIYRYVVETEEGKQIKELRNRSTVYIKEGPYEPKIEFRTKKITNSFTSLFANLMFVENEKIYIYVPTGTILEDYNIDLE